MSLFFFFTLFYSFGTHWWSFSSRLLFSCVLIPPVPSTLPPAWQGSVHVCVFQHEHDRARSQPRTVKTNPYPPTIPSALTVPLGSVAVTFFNAHFPFPGFGAARRMQKNVPELFSHRLPVVAWKGSSPSPPLEGLGSNSSIIMNYCMLYHNRKSFHMQFAFMRGSVFFCFSSRQGLLLFIPNGPSVGWGNTYSHVGVCSRTFLLFQHKRRTEPGCIRRWNKMAQENEAVWWISAEDTPGPIVEEVPVWPTGSIHLPNWVLFMPVWSNI